MSEEAPTTFFKVLIPRVLPAMISSLDCDLCGKKGVLVSFYLHAASDRRVVKGFYPDFSVHLCKSCVEEALATFTKSRVEE